MSFGQSPICDSGKNEPEVRPSRGEKPSVTPKPAKLKELGEPLKAKKVPPPVAPKPNRFGQAAPFSPQTPPRQEEQYAEYMRSRGSSEGDGEMSFIAPPAAQTRRRVPPMPARGPYSIDPETRRRVFKQADSSGPNAQTPPRGDEQYTEYMRSRAPSQGDGEMSFMESADSRRKSKGPYTIDPLTRRRVFGKSGGSVRRSAKGPSSFFGTESIHDVTSRNFDEVTKSMEKAFVMFYDPMSEGCACAGVEFLKASEMPHPDNYAFAAIDCTRDQDICDREGASTLPMFKLYSNGFEMSTIRNTKRFCAEQMYKMMKTTPASEMPHPDNYAFAAIDCTRDQDICDHEGASTLPMFILYSNGFEMSTIRNTKGFCAEQMQTMMKTTPVLNEPTTTVTPGLERR